MPQIEIEKLLHQAMGLDAESIGSVSIERAMLRRMAESGARDMNEYWQRLRSSPDELQELVEAVVVPETWFFRHHEAFTALKRFAASQWLPSHPVGTLRILSVPCSTGEEPYSIVMALLDSGLAPDRFSVEAWDISHRALAQATKATYGRNSFRGSDLSFRDLHFHSVTEGFQVVETIRRQVTFRQRNLLAPHYQFGAARFDVIFCRNVLIYFDRANQEHAVTNLRHLLTPEGIAFVGPAEALLMRGEGFFSTGEPMSFAFKCCNEPRPLLPSAAPEKMPPRTPLKTALKSPPAIFTRATPIPTKAATSAKMPGTPLAASPSLSQTTDLAAAQRFADAGRMEEAAHACEAYLREQGDSAPAYYLLGLIRDTQGDQARAVQSYRKALYLAPNHTEALVHLALLMEQQGNAGEARRLHERARRVTQVGMNA